MLFTGLASLLNMLKETAHIPKKQLDMPLVFAVDHCFSIRGQGTILTGTVLQGKVSLKDVGDPKSVSFPISKQEQYVFFMFNRKYRYHPLASPLK